MTYHLRSMFAVSLALVASGCVARPTVVGAPTVSASSASPALATTLLASSTALMPRAVTSFGAAELAGAVYAYGGYSGVPHAYNREGQSGELWKLDPVAQTFELVATGEPTQGPALVSHGDSLLRVGGMRARNSKGQPDDVWSLDEVAAYAPATKAWTNLPALPQPRSSHAAAIIDSTLYVVGGWQLTGSPSSGAFVDTLLALDLNTRVYRSVPQPFARRAVAAAALDGKLVILGGIAADGAISREVQVFDPKTSTFTRAADFPADGFGMAASSSGDVLYASARDGVLYALAEPTGRWTKVSELVFPRFFHQLVQLSPTQVLALGGISGMHAGPRIREVEVVDVSSTQAGPRVMSLVVDNPVRARNRQGVFVHGDSLYVFGGNRSLGQHAFLPEDFVREGARFDLHAAAWAPMAPLPVARQTVQTLVEGEHALALGGSGHDGKGARSHADAFRYDLQRDTWTSDPSVLPTPRTQFGLVTHDNQRWVFGGLDFKPEAKGEAQFDHPTSVLRAAEGQPFSASGVELPRPRRAFGGAELDGRYYLVGGMAGGFASLADCDVFEFASSSWSEIPCPKSRIAPQLVALKGKLYLAGGSSAGDGGGLAPNRSLEVFDPKTSAWTTLIEQLPVETRHLTMLAYRGSLLLYSAHDEQGRVSIAIVTP